MKSPMTLIRMIGVLFIALPAIMTFAAIPNASAQTGDSSIEVHHRICPEGYTGDDFFNDCHDNVADPGLPFTFSGPVEREGTTNEDGNIGFANLPAGTYTISGGPPASVTDIVVYCSVGTGEVSDQEPLPVTYVTGGFQIELPANTNVICDWYTIPQGEGPPQDSGDSSIEVHSRICPEGYEGGNWFEDCHDNIPDPGLPYTFSNSVTREGTTNENGNVGFANLPAGTYTITGGAPGAYAEYAVYCSVGTESESNQSQVPVEYVQGGIQLDLPADTNVICDWYIVPESQQGQPPPTEEAQLFDLPIYKLLCEDDPGDGVIQDFVMVGSVPDGCEQYAGVSVTITDADGTVIGTCVTEADSPCYVTVTVGETVYASEDLSTVPDGYAPLDSETREVPIPPASEAWVVFVNVAVQPTPTVAPSPTIEPTPTEVPLPPDRPALIMTGSCADPDATQVVAQLNDLREPEGNVEGQLDAVTAETSTSTIGISLDEMLANDQILVVFEDDDLEATGDPVACAPIGGIVDDDGELVIGLLEQNGSDYTGIVYMAPSADDPSQISVSVFVAEGLEEEDIEATPGA